MRAPRTLTVLLGITCTLGALVAPATAAQAADPSAGTLTGRVTAGTGAAGVGPGVHVGWYDPSDQGGLPHSAVTDGAGRYRLDLPPVGTSYVLFAGVAQADAPARPDLASTVASYFGAGDAEAAAFQLLQPYTAVAGDRALDIGLTAAGTIEGRQAALANRFVELRTLGGTVADSQRADDSGHYSFSVVPGSYTLLATRDGGHVDGTSGTVTVLAGSTATPTLTTATTPVVQGVVTSGRSAASGVPIRFHAVDPTPPSAPKDVTTKTDSRGRYRVRVPVAATYTVSFGSTTDAVTRSAWAGEVHTLKDVAASTTRRLDVAVARGGRITGTFRAGARAVRTNYLVTTRGRDAAVIATGVYGDSARERTWPVGARGLPSGTYSLIAFDDRSKRYAERKVVVRAGRTVALGRLTTSSTHRRFSVSGTVASGAGGTIELRAGTFSRKLRLDATGRYHATGLVPAPYTVTLTVPGHATATRHAQLSKAGTRDFPAGAALASVTAVVRVGAAHAVVQQSPVDANALVFAGGRFPALIDRGVLSATHVPAGAYTVIGVVGDGQALPIASPYYYDVPARLRDLRLAPGERLDLGPDPVDLLVHR